MVPFYRGAAARITVARFCILLLGGLVPAAAAPPAFVVELCPIFSFRGGVYVEGPGRLAGSATIGSSVGITTLTARATALYGLEQPWLGAAWSLEAGVPLVVVNFIEGRYVDWEEHIEGPFYGIAPGAGVAAMWTTRRYRRIGVSLSAAVYREWQSGEWSNPLPVPVFTFRFLPKKTAPTGAVSFDGR